MLTDEEDQPIEEFAKSTPFEVAAIKLAVSSADRDFVVIERRSQIVIVSQPGSRARSEAKVVKPLNSQVGSAPPLHLGPGLTMVSSDQWRQYQSHPPVAASLIDGTTREVFSVQELDAASIGLTTDAVVLGWVAWRTSPDGPESSSVLNSAARARLARLSR